MEEKHEPWRVTISAKMKMGQGTAPAVSYVQAPAKYLTMLQDHQTNPTKCAII